MRVAALSASAIPSTGFRSKVLLCARRTEAHHGYTLPSKSGRNRHSMGCSVRAQASENFGHSNSFSALLNKLAYEIQNISTEKLEEFPWKKARSIIAERLLVLGTGALKWSFVLLFIVSFLSDIIIAISMNRELMIPLGLFTGVILADFLKESFHEFFQTNTKDKPFAKQLVSVGSVFVFIKFLAMCFSAQWRMLLFHISNGGLMQVLWLAKELQQNTTRVEIQEEQEISDTSPTH